MKNKQLFRMLLSSTVVLSSVLAGCTADSSETKITNTASVTSSTFTGTVTSVDGNKVTMEIQTSSSADQGMMMQGMQQEMHSQMQENVQETEQMEKPDGDPGSGSMEEMPDQPEGGSTPPDKPEGETDNSSTPPEKPDGESNGGGEAPDVPENANNQNAVNESVPEMPSGNDMTMTEMPSDPVIVVLTLEDASVITAADGSAADLSAIEEGTSLTVTVDESGSVTSVEINEGMQQTASGGPGGMSSGNVSYTAVTTYTEDSTESKTAFESTGTDENAVLVDEGAEVKLSDITVSRISSSSTGGDNSSFYGVGAALLNIDGTLYIDGADIDTDASGGAGIFAYGEGTVYVQNADIVTEKSTSGGIHAAGGGTLYAWDCTAETSGESSAAIRSDRGGGTMVVEGGSYTTNGTGSPAVYCTADITVSGAELTANNSEGICIEGLNTLRLFDCDLTGTMQDNAQNDCTWNVIVYQSMSGDSEVGNGTFEMTGGSLTANNGGIFYTTNTECTFIISDVDITYADENDFFLQCTGNTNARGWGSSGKNGSDCTFTAISQDMEGDIIYDSISSLDFYMTYGSSLTGAFVDDETWAGNGGNGTCTLTIDSTSVWTVTADSVVTKLNNAGKITDASGKTVTIKGTDGTVYVQGDSEYTVTVTAYSENADLSNAGQAETYSDFSVKNPF